MLYISFVSAQVKKELRPISKLQLSSENQPTWNPHSNKELILKPLHVNNAQILKAGRRRLHIPRKRSIRFKQNMICTLENSTLWRHELCIYIFIYLITYLFIYFSDFAVERP